MIPGDLHVTETIRIESAQQLAGIVADAASANQPLVPIGGGTALATGNTTTCPYVALDMRGLRGIETYVPTDLTASFRAGTSVQEVRAVLAANGQQLPLDLADDDAGTIGGLVATGFSGPSRLGCGTLKDLLIGCEYVRGDGLLAKAGGMTVKNVSGFEISRLLHGSWGSLAILTRVNLKLLPKPRSDRTIAWQDTDLAVGLARQQALLRDLPMAVAALTHVSAAGVHTSLRFIGREVAVEDHLARSRRLVGEPMGEIPSWQLPPTSELHPILICTSSPDDIGKLAIALGHHEGIVALHVAAGLGTLWATVDPDCVSALTLARLAAGLWRIEGGTPAWKGAVNVWGESHAAAVAQSVKQQFDPAGILNRGRLFV